METSVPKLHLRRYSCGDVRKWRRRSSVGVERPQMASLENEVRTEHKFGGSRNRRKSTTELEDPFDDPALVTNAFLDITWQDARGNSALMLAAAENRILHVKGILTMAAQRGTLWQVLNMRNEEGLTALEMAVRAGSDTCAMLITKYARTAQKTRPRLRGMSLTRRASGEANENDIMIELDDAPPLAAPFASRRPFVLDAHSRRLSRDKITNSLKRLPPTTPVRIENNSSPQGKVESRPISNDSVSSLPSPANSPSADLSRSFSVGEKLRSIFSGRWNMDSEPAPSKRPQEYKKNSEDYAAQGRPATSPIAADQKVSVDEVFRSPWPTSKPTRLPPLRNLRRRTASEGRRRSGAQEPLT